MKLTFDEAIAKVRSERAHQDAKWGSLEQHNQSIPGYLVILQSELDEARAGWMKNVEGDHSSLSEIRQIAAVAVACMEQYGIEGN